MVGFGDILLAAGGFWGLGLGFGLGGFFGRVGGIVGGRWVLGNAGFLEGVLGCGGCFAVVLVLVGFFFVAPVLEDFWLGAIVDGFEGGLVRGLVFWLGGGLMLGFLLTVVFGAGVLLTAFFCLASSSLSPVISPPMYFCARSISCFDSGPWSPFF